MNLEKVCTCCCISRTGAGSGLDPIWSNMLPKPSNSESSRTRSESNNLGGVAVLAVLAVAVLFLRFPGCGGSSPRGDVGVDRPSLLVPKDRARGGLRRYPDLAVGGA